MTKQQLVELVDRIYLNWNQQMPGVESKKKTLYEAWWRILANLDNEMAHQAVDQLALADGYMPRPGTVYRTAIRLQYDFDPPEPAQAWDQFRVMAEAAQSGTYQPGTDIHPLVKQTVQTLGGTNAYRLHTNGDRELFINTYQRAVLHEEARLHGTPTTVGEEVSADHAG